MASCDGAGIMLGSAINGWISGDRIVRRILPLLTVVLIASCDSTDSAKKGQAAPPDVKYNQALEYYTLTHEEQGGRRRWKQVSQIDAETARRLLELQRAVEAWQDEKADTRVVGKDRRDIAQIIEDLFDDPASRMRMVLKTCDLEECERVITRFYNKNRCFVRVMFFDRGPTAQAGLDVYLFKYEGTWEIIHRTDWIN